MESSDGMRWRRKSHRKNQQICHTRWGKSKESGQGLGLELRSEFLRDMEQGRSGNGDKSRRMRRRRRRRRRRNHRYGDGDGKALFLFVPLFLKKRERERDGEGEQGSIFIQRRGRERI